MSAPSFTPTIPLDQLTPDGVAWHAQATITHPEPPEGWLLVGLAVWSSALGEYAINLVRRGGTIGNARSRDVVDDSIKRHGYRASEWNDTYAGAQLVSIYERDWSLANAR